MISEKTYKALKLLVYTDTTLDSGATPTSFGKGYFKDEWRTATQKKYRYAAALMLGRLRKAGYVRYRQVYDNLLNVITKEGKEAIKEYELKQQ
jgi:hypothetical protein